jgi:hypothetical protein
MMCTGRMTRTVMGTIRTAAKGPRMVKSVDDRGRGARLARRNEGAYCWYVTEPQRSRPGCIGCDGDRLDHSRALAAADSVPGCALPKQRNARAVPLDKGRAHNQQDADYGQPDPAEQ